MKKIIYCISIFIAVLLSGCSKSDVTAENKSIQSDQTQNNLLEKTVGNEMLLSEYPQALERSYTNFLLPSTTTIDYTNLYSQLNLIQASGFEVNAEAVFQMFFEEQLLENEEITSESTDFHDSKQLVDEENKLYGVVRDDGFVSIIKPAGWDIQFSQDFVVEDIIHVDRGDVLDDSYPLYDGTESLQDAVDYVNDWLNQNWVIWEPDFIYQVKTVEVRKIDSNYFYDMIIEKVYDGIPLDDIININGYKTDENNNLLLEYTISPIKIRMYHCNSIDVFSNSPGIVEVRSKSEEAEGWLSLPQCMLMLEQLFSEYTVYEVSDIEIKYVICPNYDSVSESKKRIDFHSPGLEMKATPVWSLIIDVAKEKLLNEDGTFTTGNVRHYVNVDMRTGEVWFELE